MLTRTLVSEPHCWLSLVSSLPTVSPLSIDEVSFTKVVTVIDSSLASSDAIFAIHASSSEETLFLKGTEIAAYLSSLQAGDHKVQEIDFVALKTEAPVASGSGGASSAKPVASTSDAKIEGAVQIAIGIKKDVDFAAWYTNVRS